MGRDWGASSMLNPTYTLRLSNGPVLRLRLVIEPYRLWSQFYVTDYERFYGFSCVSLLILFLGKIKLFRTEFTYPVIILISSFV